MAELFFEGDLNFENLDAKNKKKREKNDQKKIKILRKQYKQPSILKTIRIVDVVHQDRIPELNNIVKKNQNWFEYQHFNNNSKKKKIKNNFVGEMYPEADIIEYIN